MTGTLKKLDDRFVVIYTRQGEDCDSVEVQQFELPEGFPTDGLEDGKRIEFEATPHRVVNEHVFYAINK